MRLLKSRFEIYEQGPGIEGIYEAIEKAGRTCYKSERPKGKTAKDFVDKMVSSKHYAMLEHGTVYLKIPVDWELYEEPCLPYRDEINEYLHNKYSKCVTDDDYIYLSTNYRVIIENKWEGLLEYLCEPTKHHERRITVRFTTDRGVSHEFVRHRVFSFAQESTRYCNYSKDKFGNELSFIIPSWMDSEEKTIDTTKGFGVNPGEEFFAFLGKAERNYFTLLKSGWTPQQARQILPNALKTELVMTGFISDWKHFFDLRAIGTTGTPHPDAKILAEPLMKEFKAKHYV